MFIPSLLTRWITLQSPLNSPLAKGQLGIACSIGFVTRCALCEKVSGAGGDGRTFGFLSRGTVTSMVLNNAMNGRAGGCRAAAFCNSPEASAPWKSYRCCEVSLGSIWVSEQTPERDYSHAPNTNNHTRHPMWVEHNNLANADH